VTFVSDPKKKVDFSGGFWAEKIPYGSAAHLREPPRGDDGGGNGRSGGG
jgi:hypothetical protein